MSEFEDKLQAILGNPDAMGQIMSIAQSITGSSGIEDGFAPIEEEEAPSQQLSPLSMLGELDPRLLQLGMHLLSEYRADNDQKTALLNALRPFLKEKRSVKVDKAIQAAKLARVIRIALDSFRKEDVGRV